MSASPDDWKAAHARAVKIRALLFDMQHELDEWPVAFPELSEVPRHALETKIEEMYGPANELIGSCYSELMMGDDDE